MSRSRQVSVNDAGRVIGQDHHSAKLTDHDVDLILELRAERLTYAAIAAKFDIHKATVYDICAGRRRSQSVTGQKRLAPQRPRNRFKAARIDEFEVCTGGE